MRYEPQHSDAELDEWIAILGRHNSVAEAILEIGVPNKTVSKNVSKRRGKTLGECLRVPIVRRKSPAPKPGALQRLLICPDVHLPYHDALAWETFLEVAREWRPDVLVFLGDIVDFYQVSRHPKDPLRRITFQDEVAIANRELNRVSALKIPRVVVTEGNHETRLQRWLVDQAPQLVGIVDVRDLLQIDRRNWEWFPYGTHTRIGKLHFSHDVGHAGVYAARQSSMAFGHNIIFGHTHRAQAHYESTVTGERFVSWTMGWLGDPEAIDYQHRAKVTRNSQHGFGVAHLDVEGNGWVSFVPVIRGAAVVDGVLYRGQIPEAA